jgi:hypothetical protein
MGIYLQRWGKFQRLNSTTMTAAAIITQLLDFIDIF